MAKRVTSEGTFAGQEGPTFDKDYLVMAKGETIYR